MIWYLVRIYGVACLGTVATLVMLSMMLGLPAGSALGSAVPLGALAAAPLTAWDLRRRHLWPLYDNLRLPRIGLLAACTAAVIGLHLALLVTLAWGGRA